MHSRAVVNGIIDFNRYVEDLVACLKPGGIAIMVEGDMRPYHEDMETRFDLADLEADGGSWWGRVCHGESTVAVNTSNPIYLLLSEAFEIMKERGSSISGSDEVENGILHPNIAAGQTGTVFVPLGPWARGNAQTSCYYIPYLPVYCKLGATSEETSSLVEQGTLMADNARVSKDCSIFVRTI